MTAIDRLAVLNGGPTSEERDARLTAGVDELASGRGSRSLLGNERLLLTIAAALMTFGLCAIVLGWLGAAHSTLVEEQVPYLISGGLLGVALALIGAVCILAHWLTVMVRDAWAHEAARRQDHEELLDVVRALARAIEQAENRSPRAAGTERAQRPVRRAPRTSTSTQ